MNEDVRWKQRFANYQKALAQLQKFIDKKELNELEEQGIIQAFEFTHELAWQVMKDYFEFQGNTSITGSRDAVRESFQKGLITNGEVWMEMIKSRNQSSHTYNETVVKEIKTKIITQYFSLFNEFKTKLTSLM
jgi:hypothetical protein